MSVLPTFGGWLWITFLARDLPVPTENLVWPIAAPAGPM